MYLLTHSIILEKFVPGSGWSIVVLGIQDYESEDNTHKVETENETLVGEQ